MLKVRDLSKVLLSAGLLISVSAIGTHASADTQTKKQVAAISQSTQNNVLESKMDSQPIIPYDEAQKVFKKHGKKFAKSKVPTVGAVNAALSKMKVSKDHPSQTIDLGNGFTVKAGVENSPIGSGAPINVLNTMNPNGMTMQPMTIYAVHAKGYFEVDTFYVKEFGLSISDSYSYDSSKHTISTYQNPPSASATANLGWYGSITGQPSVQKYDSTAADAIADAEYKYFNALGNYGGHIELRFTGTGNYYMHDTYIGGSEY